MKSFKDLAQEIVNKVDEDAPANAVGTGANVALPPTHEPGVMKKKKKKHDPILINNLKRKVQENNDNNSVMLKGVLDKLEELDNIVDEASGVEKELIGEQEFQGEYTTFKDRYMGQMLNETDTAAAKQMERLLIHSNGGTQSKSFGAIKKKIKGKNFDTPEDLGKAIIDKARKLGKFGTGGIEVKSGKVNTAQWKGKNKTPKTDITLGSHRVSVKTGSAQLMSGAIDETMSTYEVALGYSDKLNKVTQKLSLEIIEGIKELLPSTPGQFIGGVDIQKKGGTVYQKTKQKIGKIGDVKPGTFSKDETLRDADELNLDLKEKFRKLFDSEGGQEFKRYFTFEAMTGLVKFNNSQATADHFLVCDYNANVNYHQCKSPLDPYVTTIMGQVNPDVKFKSTAIKKTLDGVESKTGHYRFWSVVSLGYKQVIKTQKEAYDIIGDSQFLTEGILDRLKGLYTKFKNFLSNLLRTVTNFIKGKIENLIYFLGLEPDVKFKNTVRW